MASSAETKRILKHHLKYSDTELKPNQLRQYIKQQLDQTNVPPSHTPPSVLVIPGYVNTTDTDKGLAASLKAVRDNINLYDTIVIVGGFYPQVFGLPVPTTPLSAYWGDEIETPLGNFEIDNILRDKIVDTTGQPGESSVANKLVEDSMFFDQPLVWLRSLFGTDTPKTKVLPLLLYATLREQVQFAAQVLSDKLFKPTQSGEYGVAADGKRYLVIIPIQVSEGLSLFQNVYVENILLDLTFKNKVTDFEQWLYYLTGNSGATFSNTIACQILVVRLSALAQKAVPHKEENDPEWKWRMLYYYTTFDSQMDKQKMVKEQYRERTEQVFTDIDDSPSGHHIYYAMSLSLEPALYTSVIEHKGKKVVSKMPVPIANPEPFSKGAMEELMVACQLTLRGKNYKKIDQFKKYESELTQSAPYSIRVYVLAQHTHEAKNVLDINATQENSTATETCRENLLFEVTETNFYPDKNIIDSIIMASNKLYEEKLSDQMLNKFENELKKKHKDLVKQGQLPKQQLKDLDLNLQQNLIVEIQVYHSWEYRDLFGLTEARGSFIALWDGRSAICEVPDSRPDAPSIIFFRLTQCALKNGMEPWDWQRGVVHVFDRTRLTKPVFQQHKKDEL